MRHSIIWERKKALGAVSKEVELIKSLIYAREKRSGWGSL